MSTITRRCTYSREDVETHYGSDRPAVKVKVRDDLSDGYRAFRKYEPNANPHFTLEWIEAHVSDETLQAVWEFACENGWEQIEADAEEIFGPGAGVESAGRSGGWAVVTSLPDIEEWDAVQLAKWRKFERLARGLADDVMYQVVASCYLNEFEQWVSA